MAGGKKATSSAGDIDDQAFEATQIDAAIELLINNRGVGEPFDERANSDLALEFCQ
jgi:hypothetical protein